MKKKKEMKRQERKKKITIRCRICMMVDTYTEDEEKCRHCGSKIFKIDEV